MFFKLSKLHITYLKTFVHDAAGHLSIWWCKQQRRSSYSSYCAANLFLARFSIVVVRMNILHLNFDAPGKWLLLIIIIWIEQTPCLIFDIITMQCFVIWNCSEYIFSPAGHWTDTTTMIWLFFFSDNVKNIFL